MLPTSRFITLLEASKVCLWGRGESRSKSPHSHLQTRPENQTVYEVESDLANCLTKSKQMMIE